ncbi:hypothetical protein Q73A0000_09945 [Kaistella flava (ex Peng et al. 2021)]|uniref:DUF8201 domain-containing protein n=1 Tax=Kaistella flava (ex Peng et al. 2021) TaxID=2038776 RepID=A0A7M2YB96_9FLAO|nr:hypothetical protein [Kaistella flava (ex Peng et al. 2021)]QOW10672.1 hypothetical protein Q73A0000_09945 [Kaistella flava (ex Peng et al. 2021)]
MLYILLMLILLLPTLAGLGAIFKNIFRGFPDGIALQILTGILFTTITWTVLAFFIPLNIVVEVSTLLIGIFAFFYFKVYLQFWDFLLKNKILFLSISLLIIFFGSYYPFILDHFGYYVPTVKWLSEVGLVQGISNLDLLLGQNSFWHIFQAGFSNFSDHFLRLNVLMLIVYLIYILENKSWIHFVFFPILFLFIQSPSADLPVIVFSLIILNEVFLSNKNTGFLFALSIFVFAIKPTIIWLPLFIFLYSVLILKSNYKFLLAGTAILILFLFKNIWTFGFPIFPVQFFDLGLSWKPNADLLQNSSEMAIMKTYDMQYSFEEIQQFSKFDYIKNWLFLDGIKSVIHLLFVLSLTVFFVFSFIKKSKLIWILFISILIKSILVLLFSAQYRFFFDVFFVIFFVLFYQVLSKKYSLLILSILSIFIAGVLSFPDLVKSNLPSFKLGNFMIGFNKNQFIKPSYFELNKYETHQIGNLTFNIVDGYIFSFDTPIPAISPQFIQEDLDAGIFPQLKGETLKDGFTWRKITAEEKEKLKLILKDLSL